METEPREKGMRLHISGKGTTEVLCKLELILTPGGILQDEGLSPSEHPLPIAWK